MSNVYNRPARYSMKIRDVFCGIERGIFKRRYPVFIPFLGLQIKKDGGNQNGNETMRIFFPLKIFSYPQYDCLEEEREDISSREAMKYEDNILAVIARENRHFGLAEYIHNEALKEKVYSLYPTVEVVDGELWGVMTAVLKDALSGEKTVALM